jgi:hypothetical protein
MSKIEECPPTYKKQKVEETEKVFYVQNSSGHDLTTTHDEGEKRRDQK